jgi:DNA modification methylase
MTEYQLLNGDCIEMMRTLPDASVHCCVTSPPYWGLRDYGHDGQIGLESTPEAYVARMVEVFREVRRVLRDDGTLWLNLGDSYFSSTKGTGGSNPETSPKQAWKGSENGQGGYTIKLSAGDLPIKPKDLVGIPWRVAFALQQPYYTGKVADERDRVWLAAMVDSEGSICGTEYQTGDRTKTNIYISVTNTSAPIIAKCERLFPQDVRHVYEKTGPSHRICYRWDVERMETKALFIREIYPYLVAKRKQAIVGYTFLDMQCGLPSKKKGYLPEQQERRSWLMAALSKLNAGEDVDLPDWVVEPPSLFEPGYYLRQDIIWHKPNPMPESVRDRCTKAHEYVFLLTKSARYYYDAEAVKEAFADERQGNPGRYKWKHGAGGVAGGGPNSLHKGDGIVDGWNADGKATGRNRRSVWTITTKPYSGAHFAVMPPDLVEPCILAGCPEQCCSVCGAGYERITERKRPPIECYTNSNKPDAIRPCQGGGGMGQKLNEWYKANPPIHLGFEPSCDCAASGTMPGTVLDPFAGSGTTLAVAIENGRSAIGCELNPSYVELANKRIAAVEPKFAFQVRAMPPTAEGSSEAAERAAKEVVS